MSALLTELKYFHFFVLVAVTCGQKFSDLGPTRYDMIHYLLDERRYDPSLPPEFYTGNLTTVSVALSIFDLNSESDIAMEFECTLYLRMNWTDKRLDYTANKTTYDVLDLGDAIVDKAWVPDLYFHHSRKTEMHGLFSKNQLLYIYRNGSVLYSGRFNIMWHCPMNLKWYPFDEPNCTITIQSYSLDKDYLLLKWNEGEAVWIESDVKDLKTSNTTEKHTYRSPYTNPVGNFSTLEAVLLLPRPKRSLVVVYIVPPILFSGESLSCFLLGEEKKMKEKEKADKEKETNKEDGDKTKQQNLDHSKEKLKARKMVEKAMEVNLTDVDERKHQNLDTLKDKEEEMEIGANGEQSSTEGGNERRQQDVGTSKDKEVEREIGTNGEQSNTEGGNERKQQGVGASKDKEEEREIGANAEQSSPEGGNERRQQDVGTSKSCFKDKEEEREIWANCEQSSPEDGNERKQQDVGTSK
ncbi:acetylcholine receptor subunit alpha-like, partial [Mercenaria mercenaria]|uniref:acetylcholine receptor subunit alpha-like n=1 Tax=Mercenaria mercenaria TaxID=6596 RepID=UPI00234F5B48